MTNILSERAMLVRPSISLWRGEITDRAAARETAERHLASARQIKTSKFLIAQEAIAPIITASNSLRSFCRFELLPWHWDGVGLLPSEAYFDFMEGWRERKSVFAGEVEKLVRNWGVHVREGQRRLGSLAREYDYPDVASVALRFSATLEISPVPDAADFRCDVGEAAVERIREQIEAQSQAQLAQAQYFLWQQMGECVNNMVERLGAYGKDETTGKTVGRFHDTLVGNMRDLVRRLGKLNITKDPQIDAMRQELEQSLCPYEPDELRTDAKLRASVHDEAKRIMAAMEGIYSSKFGQQEAA